MYTIIRQKSFSRRNLIRNIMFLLSVFVIIAASSYSRAEAKDFTRDDGSWYWPTEGGLSNISDWNGDAPAAKCSICGSNIDSYHTCIVHTASTYGHNGLDIGVGYGTKVYAAAGGKATYYDMYSNYTGTRGNTIVIEHKLNNGYSYYTVYQHLAYSSLTQSDVKAGDIIAAVGNTGGVDYHLHFEILYAPSGFINSPNDITTLENIDYLATESETKGRILANPAVQNNEMAYPQVSDKDLQVCLYNHPGTVHYTQDTSKVNIGTASYRKSQTDGGDIEISSTEASMYVGETLTLSASGTYKSAAWSSSDKSVVSIGSPKKGKTDINALTKGKTTLTVKCTTASGKTVSKKCAITINEPYLDTNDVSLVIGSKQTLNLTGDTIASCTSSKKSVATVSANGVITAKGAGKATITVIGKNSGYTFTCTVNVRKNAASQIKIPDGFTVVGDSFGGVVLVKNSSGKYGAIDYNGKVLVKATLNSSEYWHAPSAKGYFVLSNKKGSTTTFYLYDNTGKQLYSGKNAVIPGLNYYVVARRKGNPEEPGSDWYKGTIYHDYYSYTTNKKVLTTSIKSREYYNYGYQQVLVPGGSNAFDIVYKVENASAASGVQFGLMNKYGDIIWSNAKPSEWRSCYEEPLGVMSNSHYLTIDNVSYEGAVNRYTLYNGKQQVVSAIDTYDLCDEANVVAWNTGSGDAYNYGTKIILKEYHYDTDSTVYALYECKSGKPKKLASYDYIVFANSSKWLVKKGNQFGFCDNSGKLVKLYEDACSFINGYAAIIDGGTAYIVDEKLNKVQTIGKAKSVSTYGQLFLIKLNNGSTTYYLVD